MEPGRNRASVVTGEPVRRLSTPAATSVIVSPSRTASWAPGTLWLSMSSASFFSSSAWVKDTVPPWPGEPASTYGVGHGANLRCRFVKEKRWSMAALTRERILQTAVRLADRDGPDAVTLRKIAGELGVHVTSLYNHVPTRDAVTDGIVELLLDEAKLPTGPIAWDDVGPRVHRCRGRHRGDASRRVPRPAAAPGPGSPGDRVLRGRVGRARGSRLRSRRRLRGDQDDLVPSADDRHGEQHGGARRDARDPGGPSFPAESFPLVRAVPTDVSDYENVWTFSVDTLIAGLRARLREPA